MLCKECGRELESDEISLHKKLISKAATEFLCMACLAKHLDITCEDAKMLIERFKRDGCTLFN